MRIGVDARELCGKPTGVGRHLSGLLHAWASSPAASRHTFVLYAHQAVSTPLAHAEQRIIPGPPGTGWEQVSLPRSAKRDRLDVFFAPGYTAPLTLNVPTVVLVHDISFAAHPEWFRWKEGLRRRMLTRWSCSRAALVLTVSDSARDEILTHFGLPGNRVRRIYPGVMAPPAHAPGAPADGPEITREPLVLFAGSLFNRRHLPDLIRAFRPIARRDSSVRLEIVGDNRSYPFEDLEAIAAAENIGRRVCVRSYIPDDDLAGLYRKARVFAFLSEYEGFGHPPLEALVSGVSPVVMDTAVAREVCGDAALYVPRADLRAVTDALDALLFDAEVRARVLGAAPAVLSRYSWPRAGDDTLGALESVA
jgi:glycosyltransferase involved in cell wall biosynthesis